MKHVLSGIDRIQTIDAQLQGKRIGLMTNPTGIDHHYRSTIDIVRERYGLAALFAVEHGIRGDAQAGANIDTYPDLETGVTVYSAYGKNCHFTDEMLAAFDVLIFDIQDVGARYYTYLYSLAYAMEACNRAGKSMVVLDRVNPIGGTKVSGTVLDLHFSSFVGDYALPTRYGLTIGEYAAYVRDFLHLKLDLTVVPLEGWTRDTLLDETDLPWVAPSPNCTDLETALCYIGTCLFEGTNISEGRGTTLPFRVIGAPFIDGRKLEAAMNALNLPGVHYRRTSFTPTFSKYTNELCHGVQLHITDRSAFEPFQAAVLLMDEIRKQAGELFRFTGQDGKVFFIDKLLGTDLYRTGDLSGTELIEHFRQPIADFAQAGKKYHLYK